MPKSSCIFSTLKQRLLKRHVLNGQDLIKYIMFTVSGTFLSESDIFYYEYRMVRETDYYHSVMPLLWFVLRCQRSREHTLGTADWNKCFQYTLVSLPFNSVSYKWLQSVKILLHLTFILRQSIKNNYFLLFSLLYGHRTSMEVFISLFIK